MNNADNIVHVANGSGPHYLGINTKSCPLHPGAHVFSEFGFSVCTSYEPGKVQQQPHDSAQPLPDAANPDTVKPQVDTKPETDSKPPTDAKPQTDPKPHKIKKDDVTFPTPEQFLAVKARQEKERLDRVIANVESDIRSAIQRMVLTGKETCQQETYVFGPVDIPASEYAGIRAKLERAGYNVTFADKRTGLSPEIDLRQQQQQQQQQCACRSCNLDRDGESVLVELRRIRDAVSSWWFSGVDGGGNKTFERDGNSFTLVSNISIRKHVPDKTPPSSPSSSSSSSQPQPQPSEQRGYPAPVAAAVPDTRQPYETSVMKTLMTCNLFIILFVMSLAPAFVPCFVQPFWHLFCGFVLLARFIRWKTGVSSAALVAQQPGNVNASAPPSSRMYVPCVNEYHYPPSRGE